MECMGATAGLTGLTEKLCKQLGIDYNVSIVHPFDHARFLEVCDEFNGLVIIPVLT